MKIIFTLIFTLPLLLFAQKEIIGKTYGLNGLEIAQFDFPNQMTWDEAVEACSKLGPGWRLPTKEEMQEIYQNKSKLCGFVSPVYLADDSQDLGDNNIYYWTVSPYGLDHVWVIGLIEEFVAITLKTNQIHTRAVKTVEK